ncbi:hypothetical protein HOLDEFILI_04098 [Holdemania filiformis DSM 12042]|uniref:Uncharacterized protein n=1 Tax=Holdemania filiformis DSM 12042 TaxID=545696 RepID=B9YE24_9FIRM|nr:hypothetical protein HOLDEFILI_04098 [Holdemania filiformis DSM 12042]
MLLPLLFLLLLVSSFSCFFFQLFLLFPPERFSLAFFSWLIKDRAFQTEVS